MRKATDAGALTKEDFEKSFDDVAPLPDQITQKAFEKRLLTYMEYSNNADKDFKICNKTLIDIRSILKHNANAKSFLQPVTVQLHDVLIASIKDKRSAVMHEGCFTTAMYVKLFGNAVLAFALDALDLLIPYSQSSIRVMSSGAIITSRYICQSINSPKVFGNLSELLRNSKSRFVRGAVIGMVQVIGESWPVDLLRKCSGKIRELINIGIGDPGPNAREAARDALASLSKRLPDIFQPPQVTRSASRTRNFYDNRAATDMNSRMLLSKRTGTTESSRIPTRPKFSVSNEIAHAPITMRSRTPNAMNSKASSQPGSRQGSPTRTTFIPQPATNSVRAGLTSQTTVNPVRSTFTPQATTNYARHNINSQSGMTPTRTNFTPQSVANSNRIGFAPQPTANIRTTLDSISSSTADVKDRIAAAHSLHQLILHSREVSNMCSMLINRLIEVQIANVKELALCKAIDECTTAIAQNVDFRVLLPVLKNIIRAPDQSSLKSAAAVKLISHAIFRQQNADVNELVDSIVPLVFQLYESSPESSVRRDCVICLVVFSNKVSMPVIRPHISNAMEKLIDVYGKRPAVMTNWRGSSK